MCNFLALRLPPCNSTIARSMLATSFVHRSRRPIPGFVFTSTIAIQFPLFSCSHHGLLLPGYRLQPLSFAPLCVYLAARCCHDLNLSAFPPPNMASRCCHNDPSHASTFPFFVHTRDKPMPNSQSSCPALLWPCPSLLINFLSTAHDLLTSWKAQCVP